jgi:hypothetical protein
MPSFITEDLSLNKPFHLGSIVNTTMKLEMDTAIIPK